MKNLIRVSDGAGHGGKVETGSTTMRFDGRYVARKGDHVSCPQHPDVSPNVIEEGDSLLTDGGIPIARHGHRATCGCHLVSSLICVPGALAAIPPATRAPYSDHHDQHVARVSAGQLTGRRHGGDISSHGLTVHLSRTRHIPLVQPSRRLRLTACRKS